jgi:hypothetical protein
MNQLSYYVTKRLIVGSKDSSGTIIHLGTANYLKYLLSPVIIFEMESKGMYLWNGNEIKHSFDGMETLLPR